MRAAAGRAARQVGHRGAILILMGVIDLLFGVGQLISPAPQQPGLRLLLMLMPLDGWSWLWIAAGTLAVCSSPLRQGRDWLGYVALVMVSVPWVASYLASWWPLGDNPRGWLGAIVFAALGGVPLVAASWPEPPRPKNLGGVYGP